MITFTYNRKHLLEACRLALKAVPKRSVQPVLECFQISSHIVTGTNLDLTIHAFIQDATSTGTSTQFIIVPAAKLVKILASLTADTVKLEYTDIDHTANINGIELESRPSEDYPLMPATYSDYAPMTIKPSVLVKALDQTLFACADYDHSILGGLSIRGLNLCATDGSRLSWVKLGESDNAPGGNMDLDCIANAGDLAILKPYLAKQKADIQLSPQGGNGMDRHLHIMADTFRATSRCIQGDYPRYTELFPAKNGCEISFNRSKMSEALKLIKAAGLDKNDPTVTIATDGSDIVSSSNAKVHCGIGALGDGMMQLNVNYQYFNDLVNSLQADIVTIHTQAGKPAEYKSLHKPLVAYEDNYAHLLMPRAEAVKKSR